MHVKHCLSEITGKDNFRNFKTISDLQINSLHSKIFNVHKIKSSLFILT